VGGSEGNGYPSVNHQSLRAGIQGTKARAQGNTRQTLRQGGAGTLEVTSSDSRGYTKARQAAKYAGVSERTFRDYLKAGLPHFRLSTGTILIAYRDIDEWFKQFRVDDSRIDSIVNELAEGLK